MDRDWAKELLKTIDDSEVVNVCDIQEHVDLPVGFWPYGKVVITTYTKQELIEIANG